MISEGMVVAAAAALAGKWLWCRVEESMFMFVIFSGYFTALHYYLVI